MEGRIDIPQESGAPVRVVKFKAVDTDELFVTVKLFPGMKAEDAQIIEDGAGDTCIQFRVDADTTPRFNAVVEVSGDKMDFVLGQEVTAKIIGFVAV